MNTPTTISGYEADNAVPQHAAGALSTVRRTMRRLARAMMARYLERETARELSSLPPYILRDIGMQREDIRRVAADLARERADAWARQAGGANGFGG